MAGSISDFKASFKTDIARPNRFDVFVPIPIVLFPYLNIARQLQFRCEQAELPSRTFATTERKFGSNPVEQFAYASSYNNTQMTFIVSDDMSEKLFFDAWMEYAHPSSSFDLRYKTEYISTLSVNQYDVGGSLSYSVNFVDAFPISINQLDLDWSADGFHKLVVIFAYTRWQNNSLQVLGSSLLQAGISSVVNGQNPFTGIPLPGVAGGQNGPLQTPISLTPAPLFTSLVNGFENFVDRTFLKTPESMIVQSQKNPP